MRVLQPNPLPGLQCSGGRTSRNAVRTGVAQLDCVCQALLSVVSDPSFAVLSADDAPADEE